MRSVTVIDIPALQERQWRDSIGQTAVRTSSTEEKMHNVPWNNYNLIHRHSIIKVTSIKGIKQIPKATRTQEGQTAAAVMVHRSDGWPTAVMGTGQCVALQQLPDTVSS